MAREPAVLVLAPMPAAPASAGNRRRLVATCEALARGGFAVDLAYLAHEDQVYRRFGQHPPTDLSAMEETFRNVFLIEPRAVIPLKTRAPCFGIDEWCPAEAGEFVAWYFSQYPETRAALVNYVFLSAALERVPPGVLRLIDTHDRFADRQTQYRPFRAEPNFFYTDAAGEAAGLARADVVLAIQAAEARHFAEISPARVLLLPPLFPPQRPFAVPERVARIGFLGHGNDPNLFSIGRFARAWAQGWTPDRPELVIAGEICRSLAGLEGPGVRLLGYLDSLADFYAQADLVVAPMLMGSGLKMKVGEALSYGRPVIGTEIGLEGFEPEDPAHRCRDAEEVKATVLAVVEDGQALARLTAASERLFARYADAAETAEAELIGLLVSHHEGRGAPSPRTRGEGRDDLVVIATSGSDGEGALPDETHPTTPPHHRLPVHFGDDGVAEVLSPRAGRGDAHGASASPENIVLTGGGITITGEHSARSRPATDPDLGILVAIERRPGDGNAASYAPERRRWFARAAQAEGPVPRLGALDVALSPEWVRSRALLPAARTALALAFADMAADWEAVGRIVGRAGERIEIATGLPGVLASGAHPTAAFLIGEDSATELRLERVTPLQIRSSGAYADLTGRLPAPVPVSLGLRAEAQPPAGARRLLLLTDDGVGRISLEAS
ncbi:glycosyltransferase involved in cell wall biosynthesis [Methylorubrum rhodinum]|uniref:Glycosyltransferase involved in cell wall biosynthesis n=1 Tax=Methylorubrum rhodinum TaxID=29428 RepID=A0A840ZLV7_9HYPH|nr:glycosyltransferase [Methylorubrum rhodinum]MBB5758300.1 glycosyltransferase involved in cell wall biosynthesis [Methylorubrum rhodinum]